MVHPPTTSSFRRLLLWAFTGLASTSLFAETPLVELAAPLDQKASVGFSWVGGYRVEHGEAGPIYVAPCFANMTPGGGGWIGSKGSELRENADAADGTFSAGTRVIWSDTGEVDYTLTLEPSANAVTVQSKWTVEGTALGMVQTDIRLPRELASKCKVTADGKTLWDAAPGETASVENASEVVVTDSATGEELFKITGDLTRVGVFHFPNAHSEEELKPLIIQLSPYTSSMKTAEEATTFGYKVEFPAR